MYLLSPPIIQPYIILITCNDIPLITHTDPNKSISSNSKKLDDFPWGFGFAFFLCYVFWLFRTLFRIFRYWRVVKSIQNGYPITRFPKTPNSPKLGELEYTEWKNQVQVGVTVTDRPLSSCRYLMFVQEFVGLLYPAELKPLSLGTINVSVAQRGFKVGDGPQDFIPISHTPSPISYFSYQLITPNVQLTYLNEDGVAYLAGFTIYPTREDPLIPYLVTEDQAIRFALMIAEPYPMQNRSMNFNYRRFKKYGRWCEKAGKRVVVFAEGGEKRAVHFEYDLLHRKKNLVECEECAEDFEEYNFEKVEEQEEPTPNTKIESLQLVSFDFSVEMNEC